MALVRSTAKFTAPAPSPELIANSASQLSGLSVIFSATDEELPELIERSGEFSFECASEEQVGVRIYRLGGVKANAEETGMEPPLGKEQFYEGFLDYGNEQRVYLKIFLGQEMTLLGYLSAALENLGGEILGGTDYLENYSSPISEDELLNRLEENYENLKKQKPASVLHFILAVPYVLFDILRTLVKLPYGIYHVLKQERMRKKARQAKANK